MTIYSQAKPAGTPIWIDLMVPDVDAAFKIVEPPTG
jgi:hypothetical protein